MNEKLNIQDLIDLLAEKHGMSKKNADSFGDFQADRCRES